MAGTLQRSATVCAFSRLDGGNIFRFPSFFSFRSHSEKCFSLGLIELTVLALVSSPVLPKSQELDQCPSIINCKLMFVRSIKFTCLVWRLVAAHLFFKSFMCLKNHRQIGIEICLDYEFDPFTVFYRERDVIERPCLKQKKSIPDSLLDVKFFNGWY